MTIVVSDHEVVGNVAKTEILRVKFPKRGVFVFDPNGLDLHLGDYCLTEDVDDNEDLGQVVGKLKIERRKFLKPMPRILKKATEEDRRRFQNKTLKEIEACNICQRKIKDRELPMKSVRARYSSNGKKITFHFTSEKRVDFRELVKDLAYIFKRRIELRQIGVRDETKMIGGFGCCGRQLCCASFLKRLGRLNIKMAKEQEMTLTPSKISGVCGRLLCCLQYENEWYHAAKEKMPRVGSTIKAEGGDGIVEELDLFHSNIKIRGDSGRSTWVKLEDLQKPCCCAGHERDSGGTENG